MTLCRVSLIQVPPFNGPAPGGGAMVVAIDVIVALSAEYVVTVLCGYYGSPRAPYYCEDLKVRVIDAFPITRDLRNNGSVMPKFSGHALKEIQMSSVVLSFERSVENLGPVKQISFLGTLEHSDYPHVSGVLASLAWRCLVVPSVQVASALQQRHGRGVEVVPNGVDVTKFRSIPSVRSAQNAAEIRLLLPSRPVPGKGITHCLALRDEIRRRGYPVRLICVDQRHPMQTSVFKESDEQHRVEIRPWVSRDNMPELYNCASLTLGLGDAYEGFGLAVAESIACETPVLVRNSGFSPNLVPAGHGLTLVSVHSSIETVADLAITAVASSASEMRGGRNKIADTYGMPLFANRIRRLVGDVVDEG